MAVRLSTLGVSPGSFAAFSAGVLFKLWRSRAETRYSVEGDRDLRGEVFGHDASVYGTMDPFANSLADIYTYKP
jgi:hypothetical protein